MRKVMIYCLVFAATAARGQNEPYYGGNGDGNTLGALSLYTMANPSMFSAYFGGSGDGSAYTEQAPYTPADPPMFYAFYGGSGDGHADNGVTPYAPANPPMFYAYFGGNGDGYAGDLLPLWVHPLSVTLLSFDGRISGRESLLEWQVTREKDIGHYELQRSGDGRTYQAIGKHPAASPSEGEHTYRHTDIEPLPGANYYRLAIHDEKGTVEYSHVVLLYFHQDQSVLVYPNPAMNTLYIRYNLGTAARLRITDLKGVTVTELAAASGSHTLSVDMDRFPAGMYLLQLSAENGFSKTIRFARQ